MPDLFENPAGLDGFEFVEFCAPEKGVLEPVFAAMGFTHVASHRSKDVQLAPRRDQPDRQLRTQERSMVLRPRAWPLGMRHGLPGA